MRIIYNLIIVDKELSYGNHSEDFNIGFFSNYKKAEMTAEKYLTEIQGFKDYECGYRISEKFIVDVSDNYTPTSVYIVYGWNENSELDAIDVIESDCFVSEDLAERKLNEMKALYQRKEWCIDKYVIDECSWQDGFIKV